MSLQSTRNQPKRRGASLSAERVLNSSSPISKPEIDLLPFFYSCIKDWATLYSEEDKQTIISKLPPQYRTIRKDEDGKIVCPLTPDLVAKDPFFRDSIARFQRDVSDGYWTATWRNNAAKASEERARGKFDTYLQQCVDEMFGDGDTHASVSHEVESSDGDFKADLGRDTKKERNQRGKQQRQQRTRNTRMDVEAESIAHDDM